MERARELGRSLLFKARGGSESSEEGKEMPQQRRSWSEVVSNSPTGAGRLPVKAEVARPLANAGMRKEEHGGTSPGKARSPQRLFSADEVAKLVELARKQLIKEKETSSGWKEVETKEGRQKEKAYAKVLVEDFKSSPEQELRCWQCNKVGHISSECPQGERCFKCNNTGHKHVDCPTKKRASWAEKGKAIAVEAGEGISVKTGNKVVDHRDAGQRDIARNGAVVQRPRIASRREESHHTQPGRVEGGPGRRWVSSQDLQGNLKNKAVEGKHNDYRSNVSAPVFLTKSEKAMEERKAFMATGGIVKKINGNPSVKDYIDALKKMCSTFASWDWIPIPINGGVLFRFPSEGGLHLLTKREVIACKNGHFVIKKWSETNDGSDHRFPITLTLLAFNVPPFLRSEPDLARMVAGFSHLIDATQVFEEG